MRVWNNIPTLDPLQNMGQKALYETEEKKEGERIGRDRELMGERKNKSVEREIEIKGGNTGRWEELVRDFRGRFVGC